jgi:hypothetical protein
LQKTENGELVAAEHIKHCLRGFARPEHEFFAIDYYRAPRGGAMPRVLPYS